VAGIGFELKKLIETRSLTGVIGAAFSGTLVVAGPWLVSAASLALTQRLSFFTAKGFALEFNGAMIWALALSICLSAPPLYLFVRLSSDLLYEGKKGEAASLLLKFEGFSALVSLPVGLAMAWVLAGNGRDAPLMRLAFALLFAAANGLWAVMMTASAIRKQGRIIAAYALGMTAMYFLAAYLGPRAGAPGALLALALGYALTALILAAATLEALGHDSFPGAFKALKAYAARYRNLALAGGLYAAATWADKAVLVLFRGVSAGGTRFFVNPGYDNAFYYANLALIPGLVYFTIFTETDFDLGLKRLMTYLGRRRQPEIEAEKARFIKHSQISLAGQTGFQAAVALSLALLSPLAAPYLGFDAAVFSRLLAATLFQLVFLSALNILFYLELYRDAALSALLFLAVNLGLSVAAACSSYAIALEGYPYLVACAAASAVATVLAFRALRRFDRVVFLRASGEEYGI
jgi:polysaccharide biosynthesis protein PelG